MASNVGPSLRLLAFESYAFSFGLLQSRIKSAGVNNIEPFQSALGDKSSRAVLSIAAHTSVQPIGSVSRTENRMLKRVRSRLSPWMSSCPHGASRR